MGKNYPELPLSWKIVESCIFAAIDCIAPPLFYDERDQDSS
jgi:hypothetical protein